MTKHDRKVMAAELGMSTSAFTRKYCDQEDGIWKLRNGPTEDCVFLKNKRCGVYAGRPVQCRTWPFWSNVMQAKAWNVEVSSFCPGVGKGKVWSAEEVEEQLRLEKISEDQYGT